MTSSDCASSYRRRPTRSTSVRPSARAWRSTASSSSSPATSGSSTSGTTSPPRPTCAPSWRQLPRPSHPRVQPHRRHLRAPRSARCRRRDRRLHVVEHRDAQDPRREGLRFVMTQGSAGSCRGPTGRAPGRSHRPPNPTPRPPRRSVDRPPTRTEAHVDHVETARGAVDIEQLGNVLMHEHVFTLDVEYTQNYPEQWQGDEHRVDDAVAKLDALKRSGIDTIVDLTVFGLGRYVPRIQQVAERRGGADHPRDRHLHLRRGAATVSPLGSPRAPRRGGPDGGAVRPGDP